MSKQHSAERAHYKYVCFESVDRSIEVEGSSTASLWT